MRIRLSLLALLTVGFHSNQAHSGAWKNWGLVNDEARSHINAEDAWQITKGSRKIVVAVIDTDVDLNHPDLAKNISHEGWDFTRDKPANLDDHGHGTHVAGIIGALQNTDTHVSGVSPLVTILPIQYYNDANPGYINLANTVRAIEYAIAHHARIINYSGGGPAQSETEMLALKKAEAKGILVVVAAGNEHQDSDRVENRFYPAAYRFPNIISVAATDIHNNLIASSNWGKKYVDVAAPGENIYSTLPGGRYGYMSGTSQATAFVSGIAALLLSCNPKLTPIQLKRLIVRSVDHFPQLQEKIATGGRANAHGALKEAGCHR